MTPQEIHKKEANLPRGQRMLLGNIRLTEGMEVHRDDWKQAEALAKKGLITLGSARGPGGDFRRAEIVEPTDNFKLVLPEGMPDPRMKPKEYQAALNQLLWNYSPYELAVAYIHAMDGATFKRLVEDAQEKRK